MKRSEINRAMRDARAFFDEQKFLMPPFAWWTPAEWKARGPECRAIVEQQLGWDITDFGSGDFASVGLFMFTLRNGTFADLDNPLGKSYCEKIMIVREDQVTPEHFHHQKMEDIINRGGGRLVIRMWNATDEDRLGDTPVTILCDGVETTVEAGGTITLGPGESATLPQRNYHCFWGEAGAGPVLVGEVSRVNDDHVDNHFLNAPGRFPEIDEDEPPLHLLYNDYADYYRFAGGDEQAR